MLPVLPKLEEFPPLLLLMELGSILENVGKMGAPLPEFLKKMIAVLKATVDTAGENTESGKGK